jgi:RimJ/RimL family protein N-acetyltransferase
VSAVAAAQRNLASALRLPAGACVTLRPVGAEDGAVLQGYVRGLSSESRYNRFFGALNELPPSELEHVTHLDRTYELALVAEARIDGAPVVIAEARYALSHERRECEFALSIGDAWRGKGIGALIMADVERRSARLGAERLVADVLRSNAPMKALARKAGFALADVPRDARLIRIVKDLAPPRMARPPQAGTAGLPLAA